MEMKRMALRKGEQNSLPIPPKNMEAVASAEQLGRIRFYEAIASRVALMSRMGYQYGTDRNLYNALGYPTTLSFDEYYTRFRRQDIAKAVIRRPVDATWRGGFKIIDTRDEDETELEKAWEKINEDLPFRNIFKRLDVLSSIGKYGVLLLGFNDVTSADGLKNEVRSNGKKELLYVKPLSEGSAAIESWVTDSKSPRYGMPETYNITFVAPDGAKKQSSSVIVHWSRMIHITGEQLESECEGIPILEGIYNRLMDIEKLVGGSGEMFWRGARPGYAGKVDPEFTMTTTMKESLETQVDEYEHNLRRFLINEGIELKALELQLADPKNHVDVQIEMISAATGIPKRILVGSERGELSSSQDKDMWCDLIDQRREEYAEEQIIRPTIDRLILYGVLPPAGDDGYSIDWTDLYTPSEKEKAEIGKTRAESIAKYASSPGADVIVPPHAFFRIGLGLSEEQIELLTEESDESIEEDEERKLQEAEEMERQMAQNPPPPSPGGIEPGQENNPPMRRRAPIPGR